ncbi:VanZ family protein [Tenuifilum thalassicum]|uniref:VanZ family protein n=1 Tax=Tenuifilum thalassicum TaxID=2590900 RepID=A0A7D4CAW6_9BACT|nr:VanZ family protein [Tenuifilum thalassicum]QKG81022.1 hypothetical protein FHG85_12360 [Tenuifilum thalassicum]
MNSLRNKRRLIILILVWVLSILFIPAIIPMDFPIIKVFGFYIHSDYLVHVFLFFILIVTLLLAGIGVHSFGVFILIILAAILAEVWQLVIPHRTYNIWDLIANVGGVILGYLVAYLRLMFAKKTLLTDKKVKRHKP